MLQVRWLSRSLLVLLCVFAALGLAAAQEDEPMPPRVHVLHLAVDAPPVDVFAGEEAIVEALEPGLFSPLASLDTGAYSLAVAPAGEGSSAALFEPLEADLEAGHVYTLAVIGQAADESLRPLFIDETAAMEDVDMSQNVFRIIINNIAGSPPISFYEAGEFVEQNIESGSYSAQGFTPFSWDTGMAVAGEDLENVIFMFDDAEDQSGGFWEPYVVYVYGITGSYPGTPDEDYFFAMPSWRAVAPDPLAFLAAFDPYEITGDYQTIYRFNTLLEAIEAADLADALTGSAPLTIFAPPDAAFEALPAGALDDLMADPEALRDALLYHVVEGSFPSYDDLLAAGSVTTLQGSELPIGDLTSEDGFAFIVGDGATVANFQYVFDNGTTVYFVDDVVLMPPAE